MSYGEKLIKKLFYFKNSGEVLCSNIIDVISSIKKVEGNAYSSIHKELKKLEKKDEAKAKEDYHALCKELQSAASNMNIEEIANIQTKMTDLINEFPNIKSNGNDDSSSSTISQPIDMDPIAQPPNYFKLARINSINEENRIINLEVESSNVPICQCGDGCSTNMKAARLVEVFEFVSDN